MRQHFGPGAVNIDDDDATTTTTPPSNPSTSPTEKSIDPKGGNLFTPRSRRSQRRMFLVGNIPASTATLDGRRLSVVELTIMADVSRPRAAVRAEPERHCWRPNRIGTREFDGVRAVRRESASGP